MLEELIVKIGNTIMSNRHNLVADDFGFQEKTDSPVVPERKGASPATSIFGRVQPLKSRQFILLCGVAGMLGWVSVFGVGMLLDSKPYRDQLVKNFDWAILAKALITFTPTNVALLAMFAGFLGGCASLLMYSDYDPGVAQLKNGKTRIDEERLTYLQENPISSALRGFVVYLTFLAGTVFGASGAFSTTTQDQYCRLAGAVAILAFGVGYDPTVFRQVLSLVTRRADASSKPNVVKSESERLPEPVPTK
jgi:hypothetical protein